MSMGSGTYAATFTPPSQLFGLQLRGMGASGFIFSHMADTSVEVSSIGLTLGVLIIKCIGTGYLV